MTSLLRCLSLIALAAFCHLPPSYANSPVVAVAVSYGMIAGPVKEVGGDLVNVIVLLPPTIDPHEYSLVPSIVSEAMKADLLVISGHLKWELDLSSQIATLKGRSERDVVVNLRTDLAGQLRWLRLPGETEDNLHGFWYLPENYLAIAKAVQARLSDIRPEQAQNFERSYALLQERIHSLIAKTGQLSKSLAKQNPKVLITYPEEQYLIAPFSLVIGESLVGSTEEITLSATRINDIIAKLRAGEYSLIVSSDLTELTKVFESAGQISAETGVPMVVLTALPDPSFDSMIMYNAGALATGFRVATGKNLNSLDDLHMILFAIVVLLLAIAFFEYYVFAIRRRQT